MKVGVIEKIINGRVLQHGFDTDVTELLIDSRKPSFYSRTVFFAITGTRNDGHVFLENLYSKGVRTFVVEKEIDVRPLVGANIFQVESSVEALQSIASAHRNQFQLRTVAITGSNGKTIVKEWLKSILSVFKSVVASPGSYNSQVGVPLSLWNINNYHEYGIFEAGISRKGEMQALAKIIRPSIGIFTNIGDAHSRGFKSRLEKIEGKCKLFDACEKIVCRYKSEEYDVLLKLYGKSRLFSWGFQKGADLLVLKNQEKYTIEYDDNRFEINLPFRSNSDLENIFHCISFAFLEKLNISSVFEQIQNLRSLPMRLQLKKGKNNCEIIDDTYNYDLEGLKNSLDFMDQNHRKLAKVVILSDMLDSNLEYEKLTERIQQLFNDRSISKLIFIGSGWKGKTEFSNCEVSIFNTLDDFFKAIDKLGLSDSTILVKGARSAGFEKVVHHLEQQIHGTKLEINLSAIINNLNVYRSCLDPNTKVMAMVKAFAYGSGSAEIAQLLEYNKVDYLSVAYVDEGVQLRVQGITLPIMVLNVDVNSFDVLVKNRLEPEIYSVEQLNQFVQFLTVSEKVSKVHLKLDTGMHRLGLGCDDLSEVISIIKNNKRVTVNSVFSHLAASDDKSEDSFTDQQIDQFSAMCDQLIEAGISGFDKHILNSAGIARFPKTQFDMVRLGIGLYGVDVTGEITASVMPVGKLTTTISQVRRVKSGETIGYGRVGKADGEITIATIAIGYADGFSRLLSNGVGEVYVGNTHVKVIGNVCMDMTMIDVTGLEVKAGDEVEIFGDHISVAEIAKKCQTIPYEILTGISERVKRVFYSE